MRTVLIIDKELGFVFWLGQALDQAGYQALPAKSLVDATALLGELNIRADLVILSFASPDASAFAETLRRQQGQLKVIALIEGWEEPNPAAVGIDAWHSKPSVADEASKTDWIKTVRGVFARNGATTSHSVDFCA